MSARVNQAVWLRRGLLGAIIVQQALAGCSNHTRDFGAPGAAGQDTTDSGGAGEPVATSDGGEADDNQGGAPATAGETYGGGSPSTAGNDAQAGGASDTAVGGNGDGDAVPRNDAVCPNGNVEVGEECDDDNDEDGDGCTSCHVDAGWTCLDQPSTCHDINECTAKTYDCSFYSTCINTIGSYTCGCASGYQGDGQVCRPFPSPKGGIFSAAAATCSYAPDEAHCWGLVDGLKQTRASKVRGLDDIAQLSGGSSHFCALSSTGAVSCWGSNSYGQTGDASQHSENDDPFSIDGLGDVLQLGFGSTSDHSCAVLTSGNAKCWGRGDSGQLGNGLTSPISPPVVVKLGGIVQLGLGAAHTCALLKTREVQCWGDNTGHQLGDGGTSPSLAPGPVSALDKDNIQVVVGNWHSCVLTTSGIVKCWGTNGSGELGSSSPDGATPVVVPLPRAAIALALGAFHSCAILSNNTVSCWGQNTSGQIGTGAKTVSELPNSLDFSPERPTGIAAGSAHTCVLFESGGASCWGWNKSGQLGNGSMVDSPTPVSVGGLGTGPI